MTQECKEWDNGPLLGTIHAFNHTLGQFSVGNSLACFVRWKGTKEPGGNPYGQRENLQNHTQTVTHSQDQAGNL